MRASTELRDGPVAAAIRRHRLIAIMRRIEPRDRLLDLVDELADAGVRVFEITFDAPSAGDDLAAVRSRLARRAESDFVLGAGTLTAADQLLMARRAGAEFGVSPLLDVRLMREALDSGLPFVPGGLTPTEAMTAWAGGATFVKVFPASAVGPAFIRELRGPLPAIELIPTGGVDATNAAAYLSAGAAAIGIGSALTKADPVSRRALVQALAAPTRAPT